MYHDTVLDQCEIVGCIDEFGKSIQVYDDSIGGLFTISHEFGVFGIIRTQSEDSAWDIVLDNFLSPIPAEETHDILEAYGLYIQSVRTWPETSAPYFVLIENHEITDPFPLGPYPTKEDAEKAAFLYLEEQQLNLNEGYEYMPNAGNSSGIINTGYYIGYPTSIIPADLSQHNLTLRVINYE